MSMKTRSKCVLIFFALLVISFFLFGCDRVMQNVEQRDYATVLMIEQGKHANYRFHIQVANYKEDIKSGQNAEYAYTFEQDSLAQLISAYESQKGKELSLSHLKVIIFDAQYCLEDICEIFDELSNMKDVAKTIPVVTVRDFEKLLLFFDQLEIAPGTYLRDLITENERKKMEIPLVLDYLKAIREGEELVTFELEKEEVFYALKARKK